MLDDRRSLSYVNLLVECHESEEGGAGTQEMSAERLVAAGRTVTGAPAVGPPEVRHRTRRGRRPRGEKSLEYGPWRLAMSPASNWQERQFMSRE